MTRNSLIDVDVKKLGRRHRVAGSPASACTCETPTPQTGRCIGDAGGYVHIAIDATRLAYVEVLCRREGDHRSRGNSHAVLKHFASYGITAERLITDNGSAYRLLIHAIACCTLALPSAHPP